MLKYLSIGAAIGVVIAIVLHTWPRTTYSDYPATEHEYHPTGYDNYVYSGDFEYGKPYDKQ